MKIKKIAGMLLIGVLLFACKKESLQNEVNNLFKFKEYISQTTSGEISVASPIKISLVKEVASWVPNEEISKSVLSISPAVEGSLTALNSRTLFFKPNTNLLQNVEYSVTVDLGKLYPNTSSDFKKYTFKFRTKEQNFIVNLGSMHSYNKQWQYVEGIIKTADVIEVDEVEKIIKATQKGKGLSIKWQDGVSSKTNHIFKIDSIQRYEKDAEVEVSWNGKSIGVDNKGIEKIKVLGKDNFSALKIEVIQSPEQYLQINFSNPLQKQQNFNGLVVIENTKSLKYIVDGNLLKVYPKTRIIGDVLVSVFEGIKSREGYKLKNVLTKNVSFEQLKPAVRLLSNGVILPNSSNLKFNFEAVNLSAVDVRVIKIFEDNILQYLQSKNLDNDDNYGIREVGRRIASKTIRLVKNDIENNGKWKSYAIDLSKIIQSDPGAIYRIELSYKQGYTLYDCTANGVVTNVEGESLEYYFEDEYYFDEQVTYSKEELEALNNQEEQFWDNRMYNYRYRSYYNWRERDDPCKKAYYDNERKLVSANILGSNLGVILKKGEGNNYFIAVNDLLTTNPVHNATVKLYNYQQQEITQAKTDFQGFVNIQTAKNAYFVIVSKENNTSYLKIDDGHALSMSKYKVSGMRLQKGLKGYIYGERGVWRPGDTIHLSFVLNDQSNPLPPNHPIKLQLRDARGKLVYKKVSTDAVNGFTRFSIPTSDTDPTGNWQASINVGGAHFSKSLKVETIKPNRLKVQIDFDQETLTSAKPLNGKLKINWLHGATGKHLKAEVKLKLTATRTKFKGFEDYLFNDPIRKFNSEEILVFDAKVDENGESKINKKINIKNQAAGMLRATFLTKAFEKGGDFSMDVFSKNYAPYSSFVGLESPKPKAYDSYFTDEEVMFNVATVSDQGKPIQRKNLEVSIYKIEWRWWWNSSYDDLSSYTGSKIHKPYKSFKLNTSSQGKAAFKIEVPDDNGGRFLIRIYDPISGHATGRTAYFYKNWWQRPSGSNAEAATMLIFNSDKDSYEVGDVAKITFPSGTEARALISIENGTEVMETKWVETQKGETTVEIPITKEMAPNVFANISLLQPHASTANDLPIRLYGVIPIMVVDPTTKLEPVISMPKSLKPKESFNIKVGEKTGKRMTYTLAVVDDGLLDLTRFKTPNPWDEFYKKEALGVKTFDIYDDVIGAYSGSLDQVFAIGGDEGLGSDKSKKANRFKAVVTYLGPFVLESGKTKTHNIYMPNYIGSVRTMVVAGDNGSMAYGSSQETTLVKKPLMVLASLPRKLSPSEKVRLPVTVFAMEEKVKTVTITLKTDAKIKVLGERTKIISFDRPDEKMVYFDLEVSNVKGIAEIEITANGNGEKASYKVEMDVVNPNPFTSKIIDQTVNSKELKTIDFSTFGVEGTNSATVEFSTLPPMDITNRLNYLIRYPHGCVEQTTSSVFPQLYLSEIFDLSEEKKTEMQENVKKAVKKLGNFQIANGGLSYWSGQNTANDWGTSYAGHFMIEAEKKGYVLPFSFLSNWLRYQQEAARNWRSIGSYRTSDVAQAYRLYTLALAGHPDLASMNRLREFSSLSNTAKWRLAAAYALAGQKEAAVKVAQTANVNFKPIRGDYYTYGSIDRNRAMALETMVLINSESSRVLAEDMAKVLSSEKWMSTQTTAYSLLAITKMLIENGGKSMELNFSINGNKQLLRTTKALAQRTVEIKEGANQLLVENGLENLVYIKVLNTGKLPLGKEVAEKRNLGVTVVYRDLNNKLIDVSKISQGTEFKAEVTVSNLKSNRINDIALTEIFPSGWEIVNTRFTDFGDAVSQLDYTDIRDDQANFYFDIDANKSRKFEVRLNASYLGTYYLFGVQVEAMYDNDYFARTNGKWIEVVK
ncbi:MAG: MG2 domain-containing protein [Urechidicola sp.]|nr:MG2 domain-containing protein [Urechidicola sp.]